MEEECSELYHTVCRASERKYDGEKITRNHLCQVTVGMKRFSIV